MATRALTGGRDESLRMRGSTDSHARNGLTALRTVRARQSAGDVAVL
jgi:hypothetical protein